ncbi:MAG: hypothetical protein ACRD4A_14760, partial [Candidatus Acidiferrales bacterium]
GPEAAAPVREESTSSAVSSEPSNGATNKYAITKKEDAPGYVSRDAAPQQNAPEPERAGAQQTEWPAPPAEVIPFPAPVESSSTPEGSHAPEETIPAELVLEETADAAPSYTIENISAALAESDDAPSHGHYEAPAVDISAPESSTHEELPEAPHAAEMTHIASTKDALSEAVSAVTAKNAQMDAAAIDSVVAKLLEKLQPQIHEALSSGVLRPLVEEILNRERDKK